ncbi:hypothetical protein AMTR_s00022p00202970 [Amborella trichopoda]|uniref:Uncharacterized protein n=1 Tax=Amborella trichopoda TaxID=13333 RepID=W1PUZ0_AMBTC|nr:hypothetical protein AMTR_s00022p00202970 [Amborella trichopoda]
MTKRRHGRKGKQERRQQRRAAIRKKKGSRKGRKGGIVSKENEKLRQISSSHRERNGLLCIEAPSPSNIKVGQPPLYARSAKSQQEDATRDAPNRRGMPALDKSHPSGWTLLETEDKLEDWPKDEHRDMGVVQKGETQNKEAKAPPIVHVAADLTNGEHRLEHSKETCHHMSDSEGTWYVLKSSTHLRHEGPMK